jgi:hypothetical protein
MEQQLFIDELVAKVVALVQARLIAAAPKQRVLMLFSGASTGYVVGMDLIRMLSQADHNLTVFMTASALHVVGEDNVKQAGSAEIITPKQWVNTPSLVREADLVLIPTLSMNTASRLALGLMDSLFSTLALGALLANKPVVAVRDGADPYGQGGLIFSDAPIGAIALRDRMVESLVTLSSYGIQMVAEDAFVATVIQQMLADGQDSAETILDSSVRAAPIYRINTQTTILTAADLMNHQPGTILHIPAGTRLTPLAQDSARSRRLQLQYAS